MKRKIILTGTLISIFLFAITLPTVFAEPDNAMTFTIAGFCIQPPVSDTMVVGDGAIMIDRTYQDAIMSLKYTVGSTVYFVKAFVSAKTEFNIETMQGNALYKWTMEFYAKKLSVVIDNPIIGTLEGTTIAKFTDRSPTGIYTGIGIQIGSHGTGIMEGIKTKSEGTYFPQKLTGPLGDLWTQGVSYVGIAMMNN